MTGPSIPQAVVNRLDTRCIRWPYHVDLSDADQKKLGRCNVCEGCLASAWLILMIAADPVRRPF